MSDSEIMTILTMYHQSHYIDLKTFYLHEICEHHRSEFPHTLSYNRFVERQQKVNMLLLIFLQTCALGKCTGISIIDSIPLRSCHIKRMYKHKTMKGWAAKGKCAMGWFYGFKLHLIINDKGEIIQWMLTPGNTDDKMCETGNNRFDRKRDKKDKRRSFSLPSYKRMKCNIFMSFKSYISLSAIPRNSVYTLQTFLCRHGKSRIQW